MIELFGREGRTRLLPLFAGRQDALLLSGLQGHMGQAWLSDSGKSALVMMFGFIFLGGEPDGAFLREAAPLFPTGFLTFSGSAEWREEAKRIGALGEMIRYDMETPERFDTEKLRRLAVPPKGYTIVRVDSPELYEKCLRAEGDLPDVVRNYPDFAFFAAHAMAFAAFREGQVVAGCGTYAHADGQLEAEIDTHPLHRRRGLALCCGANFLLACVEKRLRPHWDAMTEISAVLAGRLGFLSPRPYPVVYRE